MKLRIFADNKGSIIHTPISKEEKKKRAPAKPDFEGLPMDLYKPKISCKINNEEYSYNILILPYFFVKGCPNGCAFCEDGIGTWSAKEPEIVSKELKELSEKYKTKYFLFINSSINPTYQFADKIADEFINNDLNIIWSDSATFFPSKINKKLLKKLKQAGAVRLIFGFESASPKVLEYIHKSIPVNYAEKILKISYNLGIWNMLDLICGFPYENEDDLGLTRDFIENTKKYIQEYALSKFRPDGMMKRNPKKYKIKLRKRGFEIQVPAHSRPFDEIDGLSWKEKVKQIDKHYRRIMGTIKFVSPRFKTYRIPNMSQRGLKYIHFINWWNSEKVWDKDKKYLFPLKID